MSARYLNSKHATHYALCLFMFLRLSCHAYDMASYTPSFEKKVIEENLDDGYWIDAFQPDDKTPIGLVAYGIVYGEVKFYPNPLTTFEKIVPVLIQNLSNPVGMDQADLTGNGLKDIIICFEFGVTMSDFDPDGGHIVWLENPGQNISTELWKQHYVGKSPKMHRLKIGHFTQTKRWEIIGLPIVNGSFDVPVPVLLFRQPDDLINATEWNREIIDKDFFHIIHDAKMFKIYSLDNLVIASREGLNWVYYNEESQSWKIEKIADGEQGEKSQTNFYGSGCVDFGKIGRDSVAYIAAIEPYHGNVVSVYTKVFNNSLTQIQWQRQVLDVYGYPNENGESSGHYVICTDFDKDGDDEFLVAFRGPAPNVGVYYYKSIDLSRGLFAKWKVSDDSAARIAVADFDNDGLLDFATIGYHVPGFYLAENPSINIFYNRFTNREVEVKNQLQVKKQNDELLFTVPRPNKALQYEALPFLTIGGITLSLEVLPPYSSRQVGNNTFIKVLSGMISWTDSFTKLPKSLNYSRTLFCKPKSVCSLEIHSDNNRIKTGNDGALFIAMQMPRGMNDMSRFDCIRKVVLENSLPNQCPEDARKLRFKFIQVDELEYYNMRGFNISFADNDEHLCHMQLWAAGKGTNTGVQNHSTDRFCEVRACIVNGNRGSGIYYLNSSNVTYDPLTTPDSAFIKLVVPSFYEHGPLWDIDAQKQPVLRPDSTVVYPWYKWQSSVDGPSDKEQGVIPASDIVKQSNQITTTTIPPPRIGQRGCCYGSALNQSFEIWMSFEFNIKLSTLPN